MDWHVSDAARQVFWNLRTAARDRFGAVRPLLLAHRRAVLLAVAATVLLLAAAVLYWAIPSEDDAPTDEFVGFYCPDCHVYFQINHRDFERLWDAGRFRAGSDKRTLLFPCNGCGELTAHRANGPPPVGQPVP